MGNSTSSAQFSGSSSSSSINNSVSLQQDNSDYGEPMATVVSDVDITSIKQHLQSGKPSKEFMFLENEDLDESDETIEAQKLYNREKNRYTNILPCDSTRVKLAAVEGVEGSDYINANFIDGELNGTQRAYIATQGPLMHTRCDFWRMVWENGCTTIVMLGKERENDRVKVDRYWPEPSPDGELTFGTLIVRALGKEDDVGRGITVRRLELVNTAKQESRAITHYQYEGWPDHGVPTSAKPIRHLIRLIEKERNPLDLSTSAILSNNKINNGNHSNINNNDSSSSNNNNSNNNSSDNNNNYSSYNNNNNNINNNSSSSNNNNTNTIDNNNNSNDNNNSNNNNYNNDNNSSSNRDINSTITDNVDNNNSGSYNSGYGSSGSGSCSDDDNSSTCSTGSAGGSFSERMTTPVVVHCSAGVGRTGTFCTIHMTLARLHKEVRKGGNNARFNLYNTVLKLRRQRPGMVQQQEQYVFCYEAVAEEAEELGLLPCDAKTTTTNNLNNSNNNLNNVNNNNNNNNILNNSNNHIDFFERPLNDSQ